MQFSSPTASFGQYRGAPFSGSEAGAASGGSVGFASGQGPQGGNVMASGNVFTAGGSSPGTGTWSPTILYLFVMIIAEMFIFGIIARHL